MQSSLSYNNEELGYLGCKHYRRSCKLKAACCGELFTCRFCHNDASNHEIDRFATQEVQCMKCSTVQPVSNQCIKCQNIFGRYFCAHCKFYEDTPDKKLFHCDDCKLCRVGERAHYIHCKRCNMCLGKEHFETHKCLENKFERCPICFEDMFTSVAPITTLPCGHAIHNECYKSLLDNNVYSCPICKKSVATFNWTRMDRMVERQPMPPMYKGSTCSILCNDCETKSIDIPLHFLGNKCTVATCGSYNTTIMSKNMVMDPTQSNVMPPVTQVDGEDDDDDEDDEDDEEMDEELEELITDSSSGGGEDDVDDDTN
ncbi:hypothetical protein SAMD00019534_059920, partial [Acytostelium subglobosum LB1]|uniref:hypothetical protein n=1 Tax=Acytostelium subglobosum LB1 TaxID=1410327 RepID=UPI000644E3FC